MDSGAVLGGGAQSTRSRVPRCVVCVCVCLCGVAFYSRVCILELRALSGHNLMYIKEDYIMPSTITFHELIQDRMQGKTGSLASFDVHEDVRLFDDVRVEKDASHAGRIMQRRVYERSKKTHPFCKWTVFDPKTARYEAEQRTKERIEGKRR
jgi:hypothetical protein